jgi:hypothetical protein
MRERESVSYLIRESVSKLFIEILPLGKKEKPCFWHDLSFDFLLGWMLPGLQNQAKRFRVDDVLFLVAGQPEDPEDVGANEERSVEARKLQSFIRLHLLQLDNAVNDVAILLGIVSVLFQLVEQNIHFVVELGHDWASEHNSP